MARKIVYCLTFGDTIPSKSIKLKKILIYVILFEKQFDDKIFETYRTQIYINNVDNAYDLLLFIVFLNFDKITLNFCLLFLNWKKNK